MEKLMNLVGAGVADLPLRPLLYTAGAAATAAGVYCYIKRGDGEKTADPEDTTAPADPVCDQATEPALVHPTDAPPDRVTDSVTEAEEKIQKLEDRVRELEELLNESHTACEMKSKECEREREAHSILQAKHHEMEKTVMHSEELLKVSMAEAEEKHQKAVESIAQLEAEKANLTDQVKSLTDQVKSLRDTVQDMGDLLCDAHSECDEVTLECEREREAHSILKLKQHEMNETLMQNEELMKVSIAEAEEKHQKAVESIAQLEAEKANLTDQVKSLQDTVQDMGKLFCEAHRDCDELTEEFEREREAHSILQSECDDWKKTVLRNEELLKVSLAEAEEKHQKAVESIAQLEAEKANLTDQVKSLTDQVKSLRDTVQDMGDLLCEAHRECDEVTQECEREQEAHSILKLKQNEMNETLMQNEELMKVSLAEAEEKHQTAVESIAQLEAEKANLNDQVKSLQDTVQDMVNLLCEAHRDCDELTEEFEREREAHSILQSECDEWKKTELRNEELLKVSLAEAEEKHQKAVESIAQLEAEKANLTDQVKSLTDQVKSLRDTVQDMGDLLCEAHRECDEVTQECEREQEAHSILKLKQNEMNETLMQNEELMKVSLAEAEEKHQKAVESIAQLEAEKANLTDQVKSLQDTVQDMGKLFCEVHRDCDELTEEFEREREAHSILQSECDDWKKTVLRNEELLKFSLAETEGKHQKAVESIAQLEAEKANLTDQVKSLTDQVKSLRDTVQDMGDLLCEAHRECDEVTQECEREQEAHSILKLKQNEMNETLMQNEELLKVSLAEAEEKHQKAVESIAQLEAEKANLTDQVKSLQDTVQDMVNLLCEAHRDCDELTEEFEREREAHSILQSKHDEWKKIMLRNEELLKVSLAGAEEKHQKAVESIVQLEAEKANLTAQVKSLTDQVKSLRDTVQDMGDLLCEAHRECDEVTQECERERGAHSILKLKQNEMNETLMQNEELPQEHGISPGSAETGTMRAELDPHDN